MCVRVRVRACVHKLACILRVWLSLSLTHTLTRVHHIRVLREILPELLEKTADWTVNSKLTMVHVLHEMKWVDNECALWYSITRRYCLVMPSLLLTERPHG